MVSAMAATKPSVAEANGFQMTEIGLIPNEWQTRQIRDVCKLINGRGFKPYEWRTSGLPIIRIQNLNGSDDFNYFDGVYAKKLEVENKQLLFAWSGSRGTSFGPHIWNGAKGVLNYHTWKIAIDSNRIDDGFLYYALKGLTKFIEDQAHGASALVHVQKWQMEGFQIALPIERAEQKAIAEALSDADALIESLEQLIAKKREIKQGAMQELLTGKRRLAGFAQPWSKQRIGDLLTIKHGKSQRGVEDQNGAFPILATGGQIGRANKFLWDRPSVLIGRKGTIDRPQYADTPFWTVDTLFYSDIHDGNSAKFIFYRFCLIDWRIHNEASGVPSLNAKTIENIEIDAPETDEQNAIANLISSMDLEIDALDDRFIKAQQVKQGMMQELLTGRIRLV